MNDISGHLSAGEAVALTGVNLSLGRGAARVHILRNIGLHIANGEAVALLGPSGSGKSTLLMVMTGLERPDSGSVIVAGQDLGKFDEDGLARFRGRHVGIVFQAFHLIPTMTALENVAVPLELAGERDALKRAESELAAVGLGARLNHYPAELSGGEQQRVALARALAPNPAIVVADEPTGNLDAENQHTVFKLLSDLHAQGRTIVMVTHDENAGRLADRRINLDHGRIKETLVFSAEENQDFDEVLEHLWTRRESQDHIESHDFTEMQWRRLIATLTRIGLVKVENGREQFTTSGEERARNVIRRHRLAERLFMDVLSIQDEIEVESSACKFEHILSPDVTDRICTLLGHPTACPHGSPIPHGDCCTEKRVLNSAEIASVLSGIGRV